MAPHAEDGDLFHQHPDFADPIQSPMKQLGSVGACLSRDQALVEAGKHNNALRFDPRQIIAGCPVIVNTSFNARGEPIVCTPQEAYRCFLATDMDALVLEDFVLRKEQMNQAVTAAEREKYLAQFELD